jgi:hypothetical protein
MVFVALGDLERDSVRVVAIAGDFLVVIDAAPDEGVLAGAAQVHVAARRSALNLDRDLGRVKVRIVQAQNVTVQFRTAAAIQ